MWKLTSLRHVLSVCAVCVCVCVFFFFVKIYLQEVNTHTSVPFVGAKEPDIRDILYWK
jgi:hypothetical protein